VYKFAKQQLKGFQVGCFAGKKENQAYKLQEQLKDFRVCHSATARYIGPVGFEPTVT